jgi:hypothetical protein
MTSLTVVHRRDCGLCEQMVAELVALGRTRALPPVTVVDVDEDAPLARLYGWDVPVLLLDGAEVCRHHLDVAALLARLQGAAGEEAAPQPRSPL